jgi:hypothetical protein
VLFVLLTHDRPYEPPVRHRLQHLHAEHVVRVALESTLDRVGLVLRLGQRLHGENDYKHDGYMANDGLDSVPHHYGVT